MPFSWKPTKFHGRVAQLLDKESAVELIQQLGEKYSINTNLGFKTASFKYLKFIKTDDFDMLRAYPHLVTVNYGINPIWCLWLVNLEGKNLSLYINLVTQQIIWSKHRFSADLYQGTLFEGEIIGGIFRIWDLLIMKGQNCLNRNLHERLDVIRGMLNHHYIADPLIENISIEMKQHVPYQYIKSFINKVVNEDRYAKGIMFVPVDKSVKCFSVIFDANHKIDEYPVDINQLEKDDLDPYEIIYREAPHPEKKINMTQEFWIAPVEGFKDNYRMYEWTRDQIYDLGLIAIRSKETSLMLQDVFNNNLGRSQYGVKNLLKFKCQYLKRFRKWEPIEPIVYE